MSNKQVEAFSFGDPEPVLDKRVLFDSLECWHNGRWYEPPLSFDGLAQVFIASPHHSSALALKRNLLVSAMVPTKWLDRSTFRALVQDYLVFGNAFAEVRRNLAGEPLRLAHMLAKFSRRGVAGGWYYLQGLCDPVEYQPRDVIQLRQPDLNQEIYGVPEYVSALQASLLNEAATLFRRKYYRNGSHAGFILYATGDFADGDVEGLRTALRQSKGPGNFRNLFIHAPGGKSDGIKLLPVSEVAAKDEFLGIKNTTRDDVLAAHRVPPQLLGIVPSNAGGFGKVTEAVDAFWALEIEPLQKEFDALNDALGVAAVVWKERPPADPA